MTLAKDLSAAEPQPSRDAPCSRHPERGGRLGV